MKKGNLYYYFKNKEEILFACHQYSLDRLLQLLDDIEQSDLPPDEKLRRLIVAFVHTILDELHGTALFLELESLTPAHLKAVIVRRDKFDHGVRQVVAEGMDDRRLRARQPEAAGIRAVRRRELDPALVQPRRRLELAGDRGSLRRLLHRRPAAVTDVASSVADLASSVADIASSVAAVASS